MLQKGDERVTRSLDHAADAEERAASVTDPQIKAGYQQVARGWRILAGSFEFQGALGRFISFKNSRASKKGLATLTSDQTLKSSEPGRKGDLLDWIVRISDPIRPYSVAAFGIAAASVAIATLLRVIGGWASSDLRFAIYAPAILATGLLAGVPAALAAAIASILITVWAFIPPHFQVKWLTQPEQLRVFFDAVPYLITVYFAYLCRVVVQRLRRGERNNRILATELAHRGRNLFSVIEVIVQKTLADEPARAEKVFGRLRSVQYANDLLTQKTDPISVRTLLLKEFAPYGENRLILRGPDLDIGLENIRHLVLLFHELTTNAVKYGAISAAEGRVFVEWQWDGNRIALTWKETGGPTVCPPTKEGFGSQLIAMCVKALDGTVQSSFTPVGFACSMSLRLRSSTKALGLIIPQSVLTRADEVIE